MNAQEIIEHLRLEPHPEGGYFRETWRADNTGRAAGTCIYFLLAAGEASHWHRVDAAEIWHFYSGAPLILRVATDQDGPARETTLGPDLATGHVPQVIIPPNHWQAAHCTGDFTLVGCTVSPGFEFEHFTLAPPGFDIPC